MASASAGPHYLVMGTVDERGQMVFDMAGAGREPPPGGSAELAVRIHKRGTLVKVPRLLEEASVGIVAGRVRIGVRAGVHPRRTNFAIARCLARLHLQSGSQAEQLELAAWLVAPPHCVRAVGLDVRAVADAYTITETCATLRVCESGLADGLVVSPERVYRRGPGMVWVRDADARALAKKSPRGLRKVGLTDEPGRVALLRPAPA